LRNIKPTVDVRKPVKPTCIKNKLKRELQNKSKIKKFIQFLCMLIIVKNDDI